MLVGVKALSVLAAGIARVRLSEPWPAKTPVPPPGGVPGNRRQTGQVNRD